MTFLLRIKKEDSVIGMQILTIMHHLKFLLLTLHSENMCSAKMQKVDRPESLFGWHFTILSALNGTLGEPLLNV